MARPRLDRPPSERYAQPPGRSSGGEVSGPRPGEPDDAIGGGDGTRWRAELGAVLVAAFTAVVLIVVGGILGLTTGLLFVAGVGGAVTGLVLAASQRPKERLRALAIGLAVAAVLAGAVGGWLVALGEGGALGLVDYVWATTGLLVPAEAAVAAVAAAWGIGAGPIRG